MSSPAKAVKLVKGEADSMTDIFDQIDDDCDELCSECGGEGYVTADCFEDTCCCADPETQHGIEPCPVCGGPTA